MSFLSKRKHNKLSVKALEKFLQNSEVILGMEKDPNSFSKIYSKYANTSKYENVILRGIALRLTLRNKLRIVMYLESIELPFKASRIHKLTSTITIPNFMWIEEVICECRHMLLQFYKSKEIISQETYDDMHDLDVIQPKLLYTRK